MFLYAHPDTSGEMKKVVSKYNLTGFCPREALVLTVETFTLIAV